MENFNLVWFGLFWGDSLYLPSEWRLISFFYFDEMWKNGADSSLNSKFKQVSCQTKLLDIYERINISYLLPYYCFHLIKFVLTANADSIERTIWWEFRISERLFIVSLTYTTCNMFIYLPLLWLGGCLRFNLFDEIFHFRTIFG